MERLRMEVIRKISKYISYFGFDLAVENEKNLQSGMFKV